MATNLAIDNDLIEEAKKIGNHKTKKSAVTEALIQYVERHKQAEIIDIFGEIDYQEDYDYKKQRNKR